MASPASPMRVFISYSRTDTEFVDQLETDLISRGFAPWVDRRRIEGGDDWEKSIQRAIEGCAKLVVVLTPAAATSEWVQIEYRHARKVGKPIIPVLVQPVSDADVPMYLDQLQWITSFPQDYEQGMRDLVIALARTDAPLSPGTAPSARASAAEASEEQPVADISPRELYLEGRTAYEAGDLERAASFFEQLAALHPDYLATEVKARLGEIIPQLRPARIERLREQTDRAHQQGNWEGEVRTWQGILALDPNDEQAKEELPIAEFNGTPEIVERYEVVRELYEKRGNVAAAKRDLEELWRLAPFYGDPAGIAPSLGLTVPPSYREKKRLDEKQQQQREQDEQRAREKQERSEQAKAEAAAAAERKRQAELNLWRRSPRAWYRAKLGMSVFSVWLCAALAVAAIGAAASTILSFVPAVEAPTLNYAISGGITMALGILLFLVAYRRAIIPAAFISALVVGGAIALAIVLYHRLLPDGSIPAFTYDSGRADVMRYAAGDWQHFEAFSFLVAVFGFVGGGWIGSIWDEFATFDSGLYTIGVVWCGCVGAIAGLFGGLVALLGWPGEGLAVGVLISALLAVMPIGNSFLRVLGVVGFGLAGLGLVQWWIWWGIGIDSKFVLSWSIGAAAGLLLGSGVWATARIALRRATPPADTADTAMSDAAAPALAVDTSALHTGSPPAEIGRNGL